MSVGPAGDELEGAVIATLEAFGRKHLDARAIDRNHLISDEIFAGLRELGAFGLTLPQAWGGLGAGLPLATRAVEALARFDRSVATTLGLHLGLGTRAFVAAASPALVAEWGPGLASGACIAAFATTEPSSGSDLSKLATRVSRQNERWVLNGEKSYITNGRHAGLVTVTARSTGEEGAPRGMGVFAVPASTPGLLRQAEENKLGLRGSSTTGFVLENVSLPEECLLGDLDRGKALLEHVLCWGRTLLSSGCVGAAAAALARAREHVTLRKQFGKPLREQPVVRAQLARCEALVQAMRAIVATTAHQSSEDGLHRSSVSAKVFCSEAAFEVIDTALQLHGGSGYIEDSGLPLMLRDVRVTRIFEGANDVLLTHAGGLELQGAASRPAAADALGRAVAERASALNQTLGIRAFRRPELLHALGVGVVHRDVLDAVRDAGASDAVRRLVALRAQAAWGAAEAGHSAGDDIDAVLGAMP